MCTPPLKLYYVVRIEIMINITSFKKVSCLCIMNKLALVQQLRNKFD